jgi:uncharacterized membrane protein YdbT with pleckstrin-like domain
MKHLDPKAVWLFFFQTVIGWIVGLIVLSFWSFGALGSMPESENILRTVITIAAGIIVVGIVIAFIWAKLSYAFYKYELTDAGFRKESGVIWKRYVTIPYNRIQNVDIYRGIVARILGLSDLQIQTAGASAVITRYGAGGMGAEGRLPALSKEDAERLRDELIDRARHSGGQGL